MEKKFFVIGDSHVNRINRRKLNYSFKRAQCVVKPFSGTKIEDLEHYIIQNLKQQQPGIAVIHVGSNNVSYKSLDTDALLKKSKKKYFLENANEGSVSSKLFWNTVKPFISNKGTLSNDSIIIESAEDITIKVKNGDLISIKAKDEIRDEQVLVEMFNNHYINIVEKSSGNAPKSIGDPLDPQQDSDTVQKIIQHYQNHPSIIRIKNNFTTSKPFDFPEPTVKDINSIIKSLDPKKATGPDGIPIKILRHASNTIDSHFCNIMKKDLRKNNYSEEPKTALVRPIIKKTKEAK